MFNTTTTRKLMLLKKKRQKYRGKVLVLGNDDRSFLSVIRSLGRKNICVHVGWCTNAKTALYSKYIFKVHEIPPYSQKDDSWKKLLIVLFQRERFDIVIPCNDQTIIPLHEYRKELEPFAFIYLLNENAFEVAFDKSKSSRLARELNIPVPREIEVFSHNESKEIIQNYQFPIVLKPITSFTLSNIQRGRNKVCKAFNSNELSTYLRKMLFQGSVLVQENFVGKGVGVEVMAKEGEIHFAFQHVRIHEAIFRGGNSYGGGGSYGGGSSYRKSTAVKPELLTATRKLIKALNYTGVVMVEFKVNFKTNEWVFLEINGRFWGSLPLAIASGADFPFYLYQLLVEGKRSFPQYYKKGMYCRNYFIDFYWMSVNFRSNRFNPNPENLPFWTVAKELINILIFRERSDTLVIDDLKPGFYEIASLVSIIKKGVFRKTQLKLISLSPIRKIYSRKVHSLLRKVEVVLFVCKGNICRSPFAQYYAQCIFPKGVKVMSVGYFPEEGRNSPEEAIEVARRYGIDLYKHRSIIVTEEIIRKADIVFTFDEENLKYINDQFPSYKTKIFRFSLLVNKGHLSIRDPYGGTVADFNEVYSDIYRILETCKFCNNH